MEEDTIAIKSRVEAKTLPTIKNNLIQYVSTSLTSIGISLVSDTNFTTVCKLALVYTLLLTVNISTCVFSITNYDDFNKFITPASFIAAINILLSAFHVLLYHRKAISEMLHDLGTNSYVLQDEYLRQEMKYKWFLREENIFAIARATRYGQWLFLVTICTPILGDLVYYRRVKTFIYPGWTPLQTDTLKSELLIVAVQFVQGINGVWFNYVLIIFIYIVVAEFMRQFENLIDTVSSLKIQTITFVSQYDYNHNKTELYHRMMRKNIKNCIRHHQLLFKCYSNFRIWFSAFFSIELTICVITFAFALFIMINTTDVSKILNHFVIGSFIWTNLLIRCFISEIFTSLNERLAQTLFAEIDWYDECKHNKQLLLIFHQLSCRPLRLFGLSIFEATRATFGKLIRITYSIFNILNCSVTK